MSGQPQLADGFARVFDSGDYSDLMVACGDHEWKVHRAVLCPHSTFFTNACKDGFKEGVTHIIEVEEDDPALLQAVLMACYTCRYDDSVNGDNKLDFAVDRSSQ